MHLILGTGYSTGPLGLRLTDNRTPTTKYTPRTHKKYITVCSIYVCMATYLYSEFFDIAKQLDRETREPKYPLLYEAAKMLRKHPLHGNGQRGGGYICICEYCGHASHTYSKSRRFCDMDCKNRWMEEHVKPATVKDGRVMGSVKRKCECCGKTFDIRHSYVTRGKGVFCCQECYHKLRPLKAQWFVCGHGGSKFKALSFANSKFCCLECEQVSPKYDDNVVYIEYKPTPLNPDDPDIEYVMEFNREAVKAYKKELKSVVGDRKVMQRDLPKIKMATLLEIQARLDAKFEIGNCPLP